MEGDDPGKRVKDKVGKPPRPRKGSKKDTEDIAYTVDIKDAVVTIDRTPPQTRKDNLKEPVRMSLFSPSGIDQVLSIMNVPESLEQLKSLPGYTELLVNNYASRLPDSWQGRSPVPRGSGLYKPGVMYSWDKTSVNSVASQFNALKNIYKASDILSTFNDLYIAYQVAMGLLMYMGMRLGL